MDVGQLDFASSIAPLIEQRVSDVDDIVSRLLSEEEVFVA